MFDRLRSYVSLPIEYLTFLARSVPKETLVVSLIPEAVILYCYVRYLGTFHL